MFVKVLKVLRPRYISSRIFCVTNYQQKRGTHGTNTQINYIVPLTFRGKQNTQIPTQPLLFSFFIYKPVPRYYISNLQQIKYYSTKGKDPVCKPKKKSKAPLYFIGALLALSGVIGYAKYDPDFRSWLETQVPGSDEVIAFIFQEKVSFLERISNMLDAIKDKIVDVINSAFGSEPDKASGAGGSKKKLPPCDDENKPYKPPRSAFKPLLENEPKKKEVKYTETRELKGKPTSDKVTITQITKEEEPQPQPEKSDLPLDEVADTHPSTLVELEESIGNHAQVAIKSYNDAICVLRDHAEDIYKLVEQSVEKVDPKIWSQIKEKTDTKEKLVSEAELNARAAEQSIDQLRKSMDSPKLVAPQEMKERAQKNMQKVMSDVQVAKKSFEKEKAKVSVTENYWSKVEEARKHFSEELEILFPNVRLSDKQLKLAEGEIDLFILYAFQNILFYQKELSKLETVGEARIKRALDQAKVGDPDVVKTTIEAEIDKEKRKLQEDFQKRTLELKAEFEKDIRSQLKRQAEAHNDHLQEAMALKEKEVERKLSRRVEERVLQERTRFKEELSGMIARLKGLDEAIKKRAEQDKYAQQSQNLWSACQSLVAAINDSDVNKPYADQLKPLQGEIDAIAKAGEKDDLVDTIVKSIPPEAKERGVYSEDALRERFLNVERVASIVAIVPEEGASLPLIFLSYLQSKIMIKNPLPVPAYELANEPFDPSSLSTFDVLQRARFWMDRGDLAQALKYMNLLQGGPRAVANDWIKEATIMLETQQAANVLFVHASASGLVYA